MSGVGKALDKPGICFILWQQDCGVMGKRESVSFDIPNGYVSAEEGLRIIDTVWLSMNIQLSMGNMDVFQQHKQSGREGNKEISAEEADRH